MTNLKDRILEAYSRFAEILFYIFLSGILSFGRAFSVLHIETPFGPVFITEIFLFLSIPVLFYKSEILDLDRLPKVFFMPFVAFFSFGCYLLFQGMINQNIFALRDVTLSGYLLFLPITLAHLDTLKKFKIVIAIILFSSVIALSSGHYKTLGIYTSETLRGFMAEMKGPGMGLSCGIAISFIAAFYEYAKSRAYKLSALIILSLNVYTIFMFAVSSLWVATLVLFVFLFLMLKLKFLKLLLFFVPFIILASSILFCIEYKLSPSFYSKCVLSEAKSLSLLFRAALPAAWTGRASKSGVGVFKMPYQGTSVKASPEIDLSLASVDWRLEIWKETLEFVSDSPLIGKGFGVYPKYRPTSPVQYLPGIYLRAKIIPPHNHILTILFKMGILGLGLFLFINVYVFVYALSYLNRCNPGFIKDLLIALLGAFVFWHMLALFFDAIDSPATSAYLWIIMGMIFAAVKIGENSFGNKECRGDERV